MKDEHLTLRIPRDLARALARWARERGVPRSQVVREAVARYLSPRDSTASPPAASVTAADLSRRWARLPRLTPEDAAGLERDIGRSRDSIPGPKSPWE